MRVGDPQWEKLPSPTLALRRRPLASILRATCRKVGPDPRVPVQRLPLRASAQQHPGEPDHPTGFLLPGVWQVPPAHPRARNSVLLLGHPSASIQEVLPGSLRPSSPSPQSHPVCRGGSVRDLGHRPERLDQTSLLAAAGEHQAQAFRGPHRQLGGPAPDACCSPVGLR